MITVDVKRNDVTFGNSRMAILCGARTVSLLNPHKALGLSGFEHWH